MTLHPDDERSLTVLYSPVPDELGRRVVLDRDGAFVIGRSSDCVVRLAADAVSRHHARLDVREGTCAITDLGSTSGTRVNGVLQTHAVLKRGDEIRLGPVILAFGAESIVETHFTVGTTDSLTGASNKRHFLTLLANAQRRYANASLALFDVEGMKRINDANGHPYGDAVLRAVCSALSVHARAPRSIGRIRGDVFAMLLPGTSPEDARSLAEAMADELACDRVVEGRTARITVSYGVAAMGVDRDDGAAMLTRAEDDLWKQKALRRRP